MKKILLTGAKGVIGSILQKKLGEYFITTVDLPEIDVSNYHKLSSVAKGQDIIIHLAWDTKSENYLAENINSINSLMAYNIYKLAEQNNIPRVLMASSIHADDYELREPNESLSPYRLPTPKNPYGATKVFIEALGRYFSKKQIEVICIRLGGVRTDNKPSNSSSATRFLTHNDLGDLFNHCIETKQVPNNYAIMYGISDNTGRIHDTSNPFDWQPKEDATKL